MMIDLKAPINTIKGEQFTSGEEKTPLVLGMVIAEALTMDMAGGKMKLWTLAQKAFNNNEMEVDSADMVLIKKVVADSKAYSGNIVILGQALELLEKTQ